MTWAIIDSYSYEPVEIIRETRACIFYKAWNHDRTEYQERRSQSAFRWRGGEAEALKLSKALIYARNEKGRRITDANMWFRNHCADLLAQGMSAGTVKTAKPVEGEARQPVPQDAPEGGSHDPAL